MVEWPAAISVLGKWILIVAAGIFVPTMVALGIYTIRKGERADVKSAAQPLGPYAATGRSAVIAYKSAAKLKAVAQRTEFISIESLLNRTATRAEWAVVIGIETALVCFFLIFLGLGLMQLPNSSGLSLFFPAVAGLWLLRIFKAQWSDLRRTRKMKRHPG